MLDQIETKTGDFSTTRDRKSENFSLMTHSSKDGGAAPTFCRTRKKTFIEEHHKKCRSLFIIDAEERGSSDISARNANRKASATTHKQKKKESCLAVKDRFVFSNFEMKSLNTFAVDTPFFEDILCDSDSQMVERDLLSKYVER
ncbi:hypothetical protein CEXT_596001 [Caerostris extrusa]|uniref:Uncharacterized protein n=1 Tax=Caerostris extrusa TaxID=172846 RepID=A0AAV4WNN9_CAEEX|nr:hypothetical protein CEXT_596001 [Caerostris extrusa]